MVRATQSKATSQRQGSRELGMDLACTRREGVGSSFRSSGGVLAPLLKGDVAYSPFTSCCSHHAIEAIAVEAYLNAKHVEICEVEAKFHPIALLAILP
jgi:hypothetical protein